MGADVAPIHTISASRWVESKRALGDLHCRWRAAFASYTYLDCLWSALAAEHELPRECPICLEEYDAGQSGVVLHCAHTYCDQCSQRLFKKVSVASPAKCPVCRQQVVSEMDMVRLSEISRARAPKTQAGIHGSKLQRMVEVLHDILNRPGRERAIVFCQFADLELKISSALHQAGVLHTRLSAARDIFEQTAVLDEFQSQRGTSRVLLLSLEQSASGTNLTAANHVLLVHPMAASTPERAVAFEQQAIGRCVRMGQRRPVSVWRFVTRGTVEEMLHSRLAAHCQRPTKAARAARAAEAAKAASADTAPSPASEVARVRGARSPGPVASRARRSSTPAGPGYQAVRELQQQSSSIRRVASRSSAAASRRRSGDVAARSVSRS